MESEEKRPQAKRRWSARGIRLTIGFLIIATAVVVLIARANRSNMVYYLTVSELPGSPAGAERKGIRVTGRVAPGTIARKDLDLAFQITDGQKRLPVRYHGIIPDTFEENGEVVVEGTYSPAGTFEATFLMAKCPSKYESAPGVPKGKHPDGIPMTSSS